MIELRKAQDRGGGQSQVDWLESRHSFSFANYFDRQHMGFRSLRVINEDWIEPGSGFPNHPHANMEILTYVLEGVLEHRDSEGSVSRLGVGDIQVMSAGTGIVHSEVNPSSDERLHLYQVWIEPNRNDTQPSYNERRFDPVTDDLQPVASSDEREHSLPILQDAVVSVLRLDSGSRFELAPEPERHLWIQIARGEGTIGEHEFQMGDGIAISRPDEGEYECKLELSARANLEALVFDLA